MNANSLRIVDQGSATPPARQYFVDVQVGAGRPDAVRSTEAVSAAKPQHIVLKLEYGRIQPEDFFLDGQLLPSRRIAVDEWQLHVPRPAGHMRITWADPERASKVLEVRQAEVALLDAKTFSLAQLASKVLERPRVPEGNSPHQHQLAARDVAQRFFVEMDFATVVMQYRVRDAVDLNYLAKLGLELPDRGYTLSISHDLHNGLFKRFLNRAASLELGLSAEEIRAQNPIDAQVLGFVCQLLLDIIDKQRNYEFEPDKQGGGVLANQALWDAILMFVNGQIVTDKSVQAGDALNAEPNSVNFFCFAELADAASRLERDDYWKGVWSELRLYFVSAIDVFLDVFHERGKPAVCASLNWKFRTKSHHWSEEELEQLKDTYRALSQSPADLERRWASQLLYAVGNDPSVRQLFRNEDNERHLVLHPPSRQPASSHASLHSRRPGGGSPPGRRT